MMPVGAVLGRLYQVEYAMEAIGHAGTCLGILASDGIVLAAEKRNTNKLLDELSYSEKIYRLHELVVFVLQNLHWRHCVFTWQLTDIPTTNFCQFYYPWLSQTQCLS